jgi:hypothetical protein
MSMSGDNVSSHQGTGLSECSKRWFCQINCHLRIYEHLRFFITLQVPTIDIQGLFPLDSFYFPTDWHTKSSGSHFLPHGCLSRPRLHIGDCFFNLAVCTLTIRRLRYQQLTSWRFTTQNQDPTNLSRNSYSHFYFALPVNSLGYSLH